MKSIEVRAKDFGTQGTSFEIQEEDMLKQITNKLSHLQDNGSIKQLQLEMENKATYRLMNPQPVPGLLSAKHPRVWYIDPSFTLPYDLKDHVGQVLYKAGTKVNPMKFYTLSSDLLFIDGTNKAQVAFAAVQLKNNPNNLKVILTSGSPMEVMKALNNRVYFDQRGTLSKRIGLKYLPSLVSHADKALRVKEFVTN